MIDRIRVHALLLSVCAASACALPLAPPSAVVSAVSCDPEVIDRMHRKLVAGKNDSELELLSYKTTFAGRVGDGVSQIPNVAFELEEGWFLGSDRGEWGGELIYRSAANEDTLLIEDNIQDIHKMPFGLVAITGLAHLSISRGAIYLLRPPRTETDRPQVLFALPGAPLSSWITKSGDLLINTYAGSVLLGKDVAIRRVDCIPPNQALMN